jgi:two-component system, sensor histidine kinase and response regulator
MESKLSKPIILAVDDQPQNLKVIASVLSEDYNISIANNGANALKNIHQLMPDLILLDIMMPDMDGFQVCRELKENEKTCDIPIIFLTAKTEIDDIMKAFDTGAVDYITKPFNQKEMKVRVRNHINLYFANKKLVSMNEQLQASENNLKQSHTLLEISNKEKDKFLSVLAHDLRNPFQAIMGLSNLLHKNLQNLPPEEIKTYIETIHTSAENTYKLLEDLLLWGLIKQNKINYDIKTLQFEKLVANCLPLLQIAAQQKLIEIKVSVQDDLFINGDQTKIESVIRNLTGNAIKFSYRNSVINISASKENGFALVCVSDSGVGMSKEKAESLFKLDLSRSEDGTEGEPGTGLGLLLCEEFVSRHEGRIWVESEPGKGSKFYFTLPSVNKM